MPRLFFGHVMHRRQKPVEHRFDYPVYFVLLPLHRPDAANSLLFAHNRRRPFSWYDRDYGPRDGSPLLPWIVALLRKAGIDGGDAEVWLQTFPRVLGFVFNPVSFWFCHDRDGTLRAVLAEVSNTFGERHNYLLVHDDGRAIQAGDTFVREKVFHVSPFFDVSGRYRFRFQGIDGGAANADRLLVRIDYDDDDGACLNASISGTGRRWSSAMLTRAFLAYPWMTLGVVVRIHWQALRLLIKRVPFHRKPPAPIEETT